MSQTDFIKRRRVNGDIKMDDLAKKKTLSNKEFAALVKRLNTSNPDEKDVALWRSEVANDSGIFKSFSNSLQIAENEIVGTIENFLYAEFARNELQNIRDNLGYADASEIERLLIKQVCVNWLHLNIISKVAAAKFKGSHTPEIGLYLDKLADTASRRFNRTAESLAKVKRLSAEADMKKAEAKIKMLRAEEMERKALPAANAKENFIDAETYEN